MVSNTYQRRDREFIDYQVYLLENTNRVFRGPKIENLQTTPYFVCVGAAQTFGCFCERPYPTILENKLDLPVLNLGKCTWMQHIFLKRSVGNIYNLSWGGLHEFGTNLRDFGKKLSF
ncbi:MAG: DUF6473 family protein [Cyanobacteriota bacterium]|nr:DUF6473 family protein [Cyanobacteriota bacterium]